ncbi:MAG: hypothetical protein ABIR56_00380 [Polaromonas sp.]
MDIFMLAMFVAVAVHMFKSKYQRGRIALLGSQLGKYQLEKLMGSLTDGYLRALGEADPVRREQVWNLQASTEESLCDQLNRFVADFSRLDEVQTRVSKLPLALPFADKLFPTATFDLRKALAIHAQGITRAAKNTDQRSPRDKAYTLSAELFLLQHTCHWFCKSKTVASARMLGREKTSYEQVLASVAPETRRAYNSLIGA